MSLLLTLTINGTWIFGFVWLAEWSRRHYGFAPGHHWWWATVPLSFLCWVPISAAVIPGPRAGGSPAILQIFNSPGWITHHTEAIPAPSVTGLLIWIWGAGTAVSLLIPAVRTVVAQSRWSGQRLCTSSPLLEALEDAKAQMGLRAPIGLVISDEASTPALLGWLRPRILLPGTLVETLTVDELRAVLLHELAHFRALDLPLAWLFGVARAVHWFNPFVHLAWRAWVRYREEAADAAALRAMKGAQAYGGAIIKALRHAQDGARLPFGALGIGESFCDLERRIVRMNNYNRRPSSRSLGISIYLTLLFLTTIVRPIYGQGVDPKQAAVAAMQAWLAEMDQGHYDQSWTDAAPSFQKAITSEKWVEVSNAVRAQLGTCTTRKLVSSVEQTEVPSPTGTMKGDFVIAQYDSSFENLKYAMETVCFEKTADGAWKASGYYIKPRP